MRCFYEKKFRIIGLVTIMVFIITVDKINLTYYNSRYE